MPLADLQALRAGVPKDTRALDLSGCDLVELPREIFGLADSLEALDLAGNRLATLPSDIGRLSKLRRLFCSGNPFERFPALGDCAALGQVGFRGCGMRELPGEALPPNIRWLTLTDNRLGRLPDALGERPMLQKLMLAGNRLRSLPDTFAGLAKLELLRISANDFAALPAWLTDLPVLSWLAFAGNPVEVRPAAAPVASVRWGDLELGALLGQGASGRVYAARWLGKGAPENGGDVALKLFKGAMTSDGLPDCERAACLAAGRHPHLVGGLGRLADHPDGAAGLLMPLVPSGWQVLAGPPDAESCSRDVYAAGFAPTSDVAIRIARGVGAAVCHLHAAGLMHGDIYAHNTIWDAEIGDARLSDFGAASFLRGADAAGMTRLEVRAWAILLGELLDRCTDRPNADLRHLQRACINADPTSRPTMAEALDALDAIR